jgi:hypothetical protein
LHTWNGNGEKHVDWEWAYPVALEIGMERMTSHTVHTHWNRNEKQHQVTFDPCKAPYKYHAVFRALNPHCMGRYQKACEELLTNKESEHHLCT